MNSYNQASLHDVRLLAREVRRRCAEHRIRVQFMGDIETAYSSKDGIVIPAMNMPITSEKLTLIRYYMIHEVGHHLRHEAFKLLETSGLKDKRAHGVWNMLEDEQLERAAQAKYFGDRKTLCIGREIHVRDMMNKWNEASKGGTLKCDEDSAKALAVHAVSCISREWHPNVANMVEHMLTGGGDEARAWFDALESEGWVERIAQPLSEQATKDLSMELYARLYPGQDPTEQPEGEGDAPQQSDGEGEKAQQNDGENPEDNQEDGLGRGGNRSKNEGEDGEASSQKHGDDESDEEGDEASRFTIPWDEITGSEHGGEPAGDQYSIDYSGWSAGDGCQFIPEEKIAVLKLRDGAAPHRYNNGIEYEPDRSFANQMRKHVQSQNRATWETNRKSGRLNVRAIKRIKTGTREHNRRIFKRREDHEAINTCITVLVDWSGSMAGTRANLAANAAGLLVDSFEHVLRVPVEVLAHTTGSAELDIIEAKAYGDRATGQQVVDRLKTCRMNGNADGDALLAAFDRIQRRPERRKIIIAIADGQPADCYDYTDDPGTVLDEAIKAVRQSGVEVYGIGAEHPEIRRWYGEESEVVNNLSEMPRALLRAAEKFVLKG